MGAGHSRRSRSQNDSNDHHPEQEAAPPHINAVPPVNSNYPNQYAAQPQQYYNQAPQYYGGRRSYVPNNGHFYGGWGGAPPTHYMPFQPQQQIRQQVPEQTQRTSTIRNDVNLKKPTLKVRLSQEKPSTLLVSFSFDAAAPCSVSVFFNVTEDSADSCKLTLVNSEPAPRVAFDKGLGQEFVQKLEHGLLLDTVSPADLLSTGPETFPLVVRLETVKKDATTEDGRERQLVEPPGSPLPKWVQAQTTYATLTKNSDGEYMVRVLKQKIWVEGVSYELQEIYGIEQCTSGTAVTGDDTGKECVICMSEPRDTTVLPCRHMCMCSGCARMLRHQTNRCPICRTAVDGLLEIKVERRT